MSRRPLKSDSDWQNAQFQDPEDFPESSKAPGLRALDNALRCTICKEFFSGPVSLRCGHSFCSQCIREALSVKQECPTCRKGSENEGHIRVNPALEEAVTAWGEARSHILDVLEKVNRPPLTSPQKRKRSDSGSDSDIAIIYPSSSRSQSEEKPQTLCPLCSRPATEAEINQHLDRGCNSVNETKGSKDAWSKLMGGKPKSAKGKLQAKGKASLSGDEDESPLPKVSYDTMKDKQIKDLLVEHNLPTIGDRQWLIKQHQQWVIFYNANLDKAPKNRKSHQQLKLELTRWLATQQSIPNSKPVVDAAAHALKYGKDFAQLTEMARPKPKSPPNNIDASTP